MAPCVSLCAAAAAAAAADAETGSGTTDGACASPN